MLKFGMIGLNEGNGHPYSYSAVFNGYNETALLQDCPFDIIKDYLVKHHRNQNFISNAMVSHIWTQERKLSQQIAEICNISYIVEKPEQMIGEVDGIIFARDDIWNHWEMAKPFIDAGLPIYMDKLMAHDLDTLEKFVSATGKDYPIMTASSFRFSPEVEKAGNTLDLSKVKTIHGISPCIWVRYAPHLLDPICSLFGYDVKTAVNLGKKHASTVFIEYHNGLTIIVQVIDGIALPLEFRCFSGNGISPYTVQYTDPTLESYFTSICRMLQEFTRMIESEDFSLSGFEQSVKLNKLIIDTLPSLNEST